jgi:thiol-disulfide isomerase/thioredoxin
MLCTIKLGVFAVPSTSAPTKAAARYQRLALAAAVLFLLVVVFGRAIQRELLAFLVIRSEAPDASVVQTLIDQSANSAAFLQRLWKSQKVPHRLLVMNHLNSVGAGNPDLVKQMHPVVVEATRDVDLSVREIGLAVLATENHPDLLTLAQEQLRDVDPEIRLLGLHYLRIKGDQKWARAVASLLDDPEPRVAVAAANALRTWTGNDFGVRSHLVIVQEDQEGMKIVDPAKLAAATQGLRQWKEWWKLHEKDFPPVPAAPASDSPPASLPVKDFELEDLAGKPVRLSEFKGKVVLLNFWTTWCTACWTEIPDLIELQRRRPELVILGISLDGQPDEHDHAHADEDKAERTNLAEIREKVHQFVQTKGITYRVVLNPTGDIGARFNGHELPTNVLIDREGKVRRRFVGSRSPAVFEVMVESFVSNQTQQR